ncbi:fumarylacetoacetate hydrolase family protein [Actinoalloteichus hymeniacidonis]|uniref:2-keto-4-pentenoate hydratase/2-oxohepta-3-ene-1,7-dioic acid hydratase n=1 Tax=Actinoalloteichus hymeniacidonis TaxID=340345 RepID=A0AAC9HPU5_9PSEU|nr:fumarylacetoacetate hydrolase family protein [Actinoalloteichus hymeniacidonis]AOS62796.1 2-keto-4-pentenoate hydratase/2-oxohepta-3-ene-1,7-dioic acid hydratase [Actinoalloteichus hymeniacidonis]MBB5909173.1 2-keto-4-pentenoate hydratase/2-oxohepta-3-ene-1,7-dioic acid hydratase in catechol pathway [Actinoalloteichus hymeniacidonis]
MRLLRLGAPGAERPALRTDDGAFFDLSPITDDIDGAFLAAEGIDRARTALAAGTLPALDPTGLRIGAPIARPMAVLCIGQNYAAHARESGAEPPAQPILFFKHPNTIVGPDDAVRIPPGSSRTDWEVELAVVIGKRASRLAGPEDAAAHIAGYTVSNDISEREWQLERSGGQWSLGKCGPGFNPLGPWLVPAEDIGDPQSLRLRSWVNGAPRQDSATSDMVFDVAFLVWHLSRFLTLEPGDVINTGTPEGVALSGRFPYLGAGDVVELEIDGLGRQRQVMTGPEGEAA